MATVKEDVPPTNLSANELLFCVPFIRPEMFLTNYLTSPLKKQTKKKNS